MDDILGYLNQSQYGPDPNVVAAPAAAPSYGLPAQGAAPNLNLLDFILQNVGQNQLQPSTGPAPSFNPADMPPMTDLSGLGQRPNLDFLDPATRAQALALEERGNTPLIMHQGNVLMGPAALSGGRSLAGATKIPMAGWDDPNRVARQYQDELDSAARLNREREMEDLIAGRARIPAGYLNPRATTDQQTRNRTFEVGDNLVNVGPEGAKVIYTGPGKTPTLPKVMDLSVEEAVRMKNEIMPSMGLDPNGFDFLPTNFGRVRAVRKASDFMADLARGDATIRPVNPPNLPTGTNPPAATGASAAGGKVGVYVPGKGVVYTNQ